MISQETQRLRKSRDIPIIRSFISRFEEDVINNGIIRAARNLVNKTNTRLRVVCPSSTTQVLFHKRCIVVFNHPYEIETFVSLAALPLRNDIKMVISANLLMFAPRMKPFIVPVRVDHHAKRENGGKLSSKIVKFFSMRPDIDVNQAHAYNRESMKRAVEFIKKGGVVLLAPEGFRGKGGRWFTGIGHLITEAVNITNGYYIACYVDHTSNLDWLRLIPYLSYLLPTVSVTFSNPCPLRDIIETYRDPKGITRGLEREYCKWANSLRAN